MNPIFAYIIWDVSGDLFTIPYINHPVRFYGLAWAAGFLISQQIMYYIYKREGRKKEEVDLLAGYMILAAIVGARLGHVLFYNPLDYFKDPLSILAIWEGGLASHGGTIGVLVALYFFARKTQVEYLWVVDRLAILGALTGGFIRLGNLMNSEMVGVPTSVPWAFVFTHIDNVPRHPAQLYEAIYCFILFASLFYLWKSRRSTLYNGVFTGLFLIIIFTLRFIDEFFKINQEAFEDHLLFNMGQILSIPFVLAGIIVLVYSFKRKIKGQGLDSTVHTQSPSEN
jgi:phosphatidylglycerol---prolipoprotein diacylglyceryl transferase